MQFASKKLKKIYSNPQIEKMYEEVEKMVSVVEFGNYIVYEQIQTYEDKIYNKLKYTDENGIIDRKLIFKIENISNFEIDVGFTLIFRLKEDIDMLTNNLTENKMEIHTIPKKSTIIHTYSSAYTPTVSGPITATLRLYPNIHKKDIYVEYIVEVMRILDSSQYITCDYFHTFTHRNCIKNIYSNSITNAFRNKLIRNNMNVPMKRYKKEVKDIIKNNKLAIRMLKNNMFDIDENDIDNSDDDYDESSSNESSSNESSSHSSSSQSSSSSS
jgi:hypothetical protein